MSARWTGPWARLGSLEGASSSYRGRTQAFFSWAAVTKMPPLAVHELQEAKKL